MSFTVIHGKGVIKDKEPDGDSFAFLADHPDLLPHNTDTSKKTGTAQLRVEGVDALETHYMGLHQPTTFPFDAAKAVVAWLGFTDVVWNDKQTKVTGVSGGEDLVILTEKADRNGRPISIVFRERDVNLAEGATVDFSDPSVVANLLPKSLNYYLLQTGQAFPTFYDNMPSALISALHLVVDQVAATNQGLWALGSLKEGTPPLRGLADITETVVLLPKLFRRLVEYFKKLNKAAEEVYTANPATNPLPNPTPGLAGFWAFLDQKGDRMLLLGADGVAHAKPDGTDYTFRDVLEVNGDSLKLLVDPQDLVFREN